MRPLDGNPLPTRSDVSLYVVDGARIYLRRVRISWTDQRSIAARVVVINGADIDAEVAEGVLIAAVEVHLDIAAWKASALVDVRVPVAEIDTALVAVIDAALDCRLAKSLIDAAEPVLRHEGHVPRNRGWWRRGGCGGLLSDGRRRC